MTKNRREGKPRQIFCKTQTFHLACRNGSRSMMCAATTLTSGSSHSSVVFRPRTVTYIPKVKAEFGFQLSHFSERKTRSETKGKDREG